MWVTVVSVADTSYAVKKKKEREREKGSGRRKGEGGRRSNHTPLTVLDDLFKNHTHTEKKKTIYVYKQTSKKKKKRTCFVELQRCVYMRLCVCI